MCWEPWMKTKYVVLIINHTIAMPSLWSVSLVTFCFRDCKVQLRTFTDCNAGCHLSVLPWSLLSSKPVLSVCGMSGTAAPVIVPTQATALYARTWEASGVPFHPLAEHATPKMAGGSNMLLNDPKCVFTDLWKCQPSLQGEAPCLDVWVDAFHPFLSLFMGEQTFEGLGHGQWVWACFVYECSLSRLRWLLWQPLKWFAIYHFCFPNITQVCQAVFFNQ